MKIIQIDGIRGMIMAIFIVSCLFAGFVVSPGFVAGYLWNHYLTPAFNFPELNLFQGILLWGITAITYYILTKGYMPVSFKTPDDMTKSELDMIMKKAALNAKIQSMSSKIISYEDFKNELKNNKNIDDSVISNEDNQEDIKKVK